MNTNECTIVTADPERRRYLHEMLESAAGWREWARDCREAMLADALVMGLALCLGDGPACGLAKRYLEREVALAVEQKRRHPGVPAEECDYICDLYARMLRLRNFAPQGVFHPLR
jgi:hypothetical protein